jgi:hypothetical protein
MKDASLPMVSIRTPPTAGPSAAPPLKPAITGAIVRVRFRAVLCVMREHGEKHKVQSTPALLLVPNVGVLFNAGT